MSCRVLDALGREVRLGAPPQRIVSLVPSETESVAALAGLERLVGRTDFCEEPRGGVERIPTVGGTKKHDVERVIDLRPDLVLANQEENGRRDVERLIAAGLTVHVSFPRTVAESRAYLLALATMLDAGHLDAGHEAVAALRESTPEPPSDEPVPVFVPIWRDPWMTFDRRTYASDLLAHVGAHNVFSDRARRFPLAADLGEAEAREEEGRDTRYPRTRVEEVRARAPALVLLPDEPYAFTRDDADEVRAWGLAARVEHASGKDLFWYGVRTEGALTRLRALVSGG